MIHFIYIYIQNQKALILLDDERIEDIILMSKLKIQTKGYHKVDQEEKVAVQTFL